MAEEGLWGPSLPFLVKGPGAEPSEESKLSDFCGIWEHLKVQNDISPLFCDLGGCTIYYI